MKVNKKFFMRDAELVARELLGKILIVRTKSGEKKARIVETEAYYNEEDPASRARQNGNLRETMTMAGGTILVYGVHNSWMLNFVTNTKGVAEAVLIRAVEPLNFQADTRGPGKLTRALEIGKEFHGKLLGEGIDVQEGSGDKVEIAESFRIGVKKDLPRKLRFYIKGNGFVSRR